MDPKPVAGQKVRHLADGQRHIPALHMHVHLRPRQVEGRLVGMKSGWSQKHKQQQPQTSAHSHYCTNFAPLKVRILGATYSPHRGCRSLGASKHLFLQAGQDANLSGTLWVV